MCPSHLKDHRFATPIVDEAAIAAKKKKKEMDEELERVKKEYEEKQRKKKEKEEQSKSGDKNTDKKSREDKKDDESKPKSDVRNLCRFNLSRSTLTKPSRPKPKPKAQHPTRKSLESLPCRSELRILIPIILVEKLTTPRSFYQGRLDKKRQAEVAKRNRERLANPGFFPSVPKSAP